MLFLAACVRVESQPESRILIEKAAESQAVPAAETAVIDAETSQVHAKELLYIADKSQIVLHTLRQDIIVRNPSKREIVLTKLCTNIYDYFGNIAKKDVLFIVAPIPPFGERYIKRDVYTEPTQSKIPKGYNIEICGAEYGEGSSSKM